MQVQSDLTSYAMLPFLQSLSERRRFGMRPGLETMRELLLRLDNPQESLAAIHIAGTNGKGSVAALCDAALCAAGYPVGRYTSPHLIKLNERFFIKGVAVSDDLLESAAERVERVVVALERESGCEVTFFETLTAVAFVLFRDCGIKLAVVETGLGGRFDATNLLLPVVAVITRIGLDHCEWLGNTIEQVAAEKAGIIKSGRPVICAAMPESARRVIAAAALKSAAPFIDAAENVTARATKRTLAGQILHLTTPTRTLPPIHLPLAGEFQVENACTALSTLECLTECGIAISDESIVNGFAAVKWPGRFQLACQTPPVLVDGAHNPAAATALRQAIKSTRIKKPLGLIAGFCGDKDVAAHLHILAPLFQRAWATPVDNQRTLSSTQTAELMRLAGLTNPTASPDLTIAIDSARQWALANGGTLVICGSLFLAAEALQLLEAWPWEQDRHDANELLKRS